jgi:hypothetical protein
MNTYNERKNNGRFLFSILNFLLSFSDLADATDFSSSAKYYPATFSVPSSILLSCMYDDDIRNHVLFSLGSIKFFHVLVLFFI